MRNQIIEGKFLTTIKREGKTLWLFKTIDGLVELDVFGSNSALSASGLPPEGTYFDLVRRRKGEYQLLVKFNCLTFTRNTNWINTKCDGSLYHHDEEGDPSLLDIDLDDDDYKD